MLQKVHGIALLLAFATGFVSCKKVSEPPAISLHALCRDPATRPEDVGNWLSSSATLGPIGIDHTNAIGATALHNAAMHPDPRVAEVLLKHGAAVNRPIGISGWTALHNAAANPNSAVTQVLLDHGADVNAEGFNADMVRRTPLFVACLYNENPEVARTLIAAGADPNTKDASGLSCLMAAACPGDDVGVGPAVVRLLIESGADPLKTSPDGYSFAHAAAAGGSPEVMDIAISSGISVNLRKGADGETPLHVGLRMNSDIRVIAAMIQAGADVNAETVGSELRPLHYAVANRNLEAVELLLRAGARDTQVPGGLSGEQFARKSGMPEIADIIRNWEMEGRRFINGAESRAE